MLFAMSIRSTAVEGRNGVPPVEGIDTLIAFTILRSFSFPSRNGVPPVEGIDTCV